MNDETREERIKRWAEFHSVDKPQPDPHQGRAAVQCQGRLGRGGVMTGRASERTKRGTVERQDANGFWCVRHGPGIGDTYWLRPGDFKDVRPAEGVEVELYYWSTPQRGLWKARAVA